MLVGFEANNVLRNGSELGDWGRSLIDGLAGRYVSGFRALLFSTRIKSVYRTRYTSYANVSTYVPDGMARLLPSAWVRYRLNPVLRGERVKVFHGLNEELPYGIGRDVKTVVTCFGVDFHHKTSFIDSFFWRRRMRYAFRASDVVVAVSEEVRRQLVAEGVNEQKIVVIGHPDGPYKMTDEMVSQYYSLYRTLAGEV